MLSDNTMYNKITPARNKVKIWIGKPVENLIKIVKCTVSSFIFHPSSLPRMWLCAITHSYENNYEMTW